MVSGLDPRVVPDHDAGTPCPSNPPPPAGWKYWAGALPPGGGELAVRMRDDKQNFPMGCFVQAWLDGELVGARVEWHAVQAATGTHGCFRAVNLMKAVG